MAVTEPVRNSARARLDPEIRKGEILERARSLLAETGFADTSIQDLAEAAGVSKSLLYYYFPDGREEIFNAVLDNLGEALHSRVKAAVSQPLSGEARVKAFLRALIEYFVSERSAYSLLYREALACGNNAILARGTAWHLRMCAELAISLSRPGLDYPGCLALASGAVGFVREIIPFVFTGELTPARALELSEAFLVAGFRSIGVIG